ncbi:hypothetical protein HYX12_00320 [Candidatus Woesearchaeota archaeon]|nr:hypothetical protein [Candidatus Woesearchaeota archaeon]
MKAWLWISLAISLLILVLGFAVFQSTVYEIKKPALYLYPISDSNISVELNINGKLTHSIPEYGTGWSIFVTREGRINHKYGYLFYEAELESLELSPQGWIVQYGELETWMDEILPQLGLNRQEQDNFKDYWLNNLPPTNYYEIRLLTDNFVNQNLGLKITPMPETIIRIHFYFKPQEKSSPLREPVLQLKSRKGFTAVEWGGILD